MSAHIHLGLVFHMHQPVGNYGFVFAELYEKSYDPLLSCLERHPGVKAGLHYSGPLLDWLKAERPGYIERVRALVGRGQVEMLGGGYYEPALPALREYDRVGQLRMLREAVARDFGAEPTGMWLPERIWEPQLPSAIANGGYSWTIVDDVHFEAAGFKADELRGWYLTEDEGETAGLFASSTRLRYLVPWGTVDDCIAFLGQAGDATPGSLLVMGDDGEKFGGWPTTYLHCWENGWVDAFFGRLEEEAHWLETVHLGTWRRERPPEGLAYLPATSYMEMGGWSLPPAAQHDLEHAKAALREAGHDDLVRLLRGGHWRNFLVRYPEVNLLQKRALLLSKEAERQANEAARDHIWKAQCNCPYWHGVFGGVYLEHIRHANFGNLAAADALLFPGAREPDIRDWDLDGRDEVCLRSAEHAVILSPDTGEIRHWDLRGVPWHLTHAVARRQEAYHEGLSASADTEVRSIHDAVRVKDPAAVAGALLYDRGMRLAAQETVVAGHASRREYEHWRLAERPGVTAWTAEGQRFEGEYQTGAGALRRVLSVETGLAFETTVPAGATLFSEWNLSLPSFEDGTAPRIQYEEGRVRVETGLFTLVAEHDAADAWHHQLFSVSNTEDGVELAPQGSCLVFAGYGGADGGALRIRWSVAP